MEEPPVGKSFAAYPRSSMALTKQSGKQGVSRAWEDLRREARKLESELDAKLATFGKLAAGHDNNYAGRTSEGGLASEQLAHSKGAEIDSLLQRLSDVNDSMSGTLTGSSDARSHTLGRHRDLLHDFNQEFRRLRSSVVAARDRAELFGSGSGAPPLTLSGQGSSGLLLRERTALAGSNAAMDDALGQAQAVASSLSEQRSLFDSIGGKLVSVGAKFPVVNGLLNAIRRKKNKDTLILSAVIAFCTLFTLIYWWNKR